MNTAWERTCTDYEEGRFTPELEEDFQCYLYHKCLLQLEDATEIHAKVSRGVKATKGAWVFPDLSFGRDELVVEIKFIAKGFTTQQADTRKTSAVESMEAMSTIDWYKQRKRLLLFFDEKKSFWMDDREKIEKAGPGIPVLYYPKEAPRLLPDGSTHVPTGWD